ncbi:MAG: entericidin A/B family lipoprotein [Oleiphilaceae bacterium]|nr:entericidin A/B family lipoprotein [Oleiphilaceae bacterium]
MNLVIKSFLLSFICFVALAGCNTMEGLGEDMEAGGEAISEKAKD